jgi:diguanylate cyclase (GGDEF)-like protein
MKWEMAQRKERSVLSAEDWQTVVDALDDGVVVMRDDGTVLAYNRAAVTILGRTEHELVGRAPRELDLGVIREDGGLLPPDAYPHAVALETGAPTRDVLLGVHRGDGQVRWLSVTATPIGGDGGPAAVVARFRDVTERRGYEAHLRRLAEIDELTGLPNRRAFLATLDDHLASRRREDGRGALLVLDLDHFKLLNDTLGHAVGDRLLVNAARAMQERLRSTDVVARLAGDEFAVLLPRADEGEAERVAEALAGRLREEVVPTPQGGMRQVSASIGVVSLTGGAGANAARALRYGDHAMYAAKSAGRDGWQLAATGAAARKDDSPVAAQLAKRSRQLALANALGARLAGMTQIREIAEATVEELHRAFGYHLCAVIRVRDDERVDAVAVRGSPFIDLRVREWSQPVSAGLIGRCLRERAPLVINDVRTEPDYESTPETEDVRAELVVPLLVEGATWGAINLEELVEDAFDDEDAQLLCILANQVAAAIRSAELLRRVERAEIL